MTIRPAGTQTGEHGFLWGGAGRPRFGGRGLRFRHTRAWGDAHLTVKPFLGRIDLDQAGTNADESRSADATVREGTMDPWALFTQVQSNIGATCDRAIRQASLIEARERGGLPTEHERNVLRGMRVSLGLEYHHEERLLSLLTGEAAECRRALPARRACHRGAGEDCPLPIRCCQALAATLTPWSHRPSARLPADPADSRGAPAAAQAASRA
ncbi:hypothetical protein FF100_16255 [Methylobacterium terricola]|uniref:Uncharacterized protein n=1 Tax=Methylobacterium terricola TaxID=2583531 RepID=A0A5C4LFK9_9HYPH|nr:hypothetical protein [Methylobacterium terricola]TNC12376.1 hypothetical protein FF100_16255 [Methylobacterium terricola]